MILHSFEGGVWFPVVVVSSAAWPCSCFVFVHILMVYIYLWAPWTAHTCVHDLCEFHVLYGVHRLHDLHVVASSEGHGCHASLCLSRLFWFPLACIYLLCFGVLWKEWLPWCAVTCMICCHDQVSNVRGWGAERVEMVERMRQLRAPRCLRRWDGEWGLFFLGKDRSCVVVGICFECYSLIVKIVLQWKCVCCPSEHPAVFAAKQLAWRSHRTAMRPLWIQNVVWSKIANNPNVENWSNTIFEASKGLWRPPGRSSMNLKFVIQS